MKILYISILPILNDNLGVVKKIKGQTDSIKSDDVSIDVCVFYKDETPLLNKNDFPNYFTFVKYPYFGWQRLFQQFNLWKMVASFSSAKEYDIIYFRYPGATYFLYRFIKKFKNKVVLEHNTKELEEIKLSGNSPKFRIWKEIYFAKKSFKYVLGNVGKASEFSIHQEEKVGYKLNLKTITNGVFVNDILINDSKIIHSKKNINLIFVGNTSIWHGLERLLIGAKNYNGPIDYSLYLVGKEKTFLDMLGKLEMNDLIDKKIVLTGFKTGVELDVLFNNADFAIGSLGLHRINILNGVPLKHREYLSRGLPFIYSGFDEDIDYTISNYLFNVEANESPIDFAELLCFINNDLMLKNEIVTNELRKYALDNVDMAIKSRELIAFFVTSLAKI
jgi:hypothetical protein